MFIVLHLFSGDRALGYYTEEGACRSIEGATPFATVERAQVVGSVLKSFGVSVQYVLVSGSIHFPLCALED